VAIKYRRLGKAGIKVSELSFGSWVTFGTQVNVGSAKQLMRRAFDAGINFFDNAEGYEQGASESVMGEALRGFKREELVISTKIFFGTAKGPNLTGLSRKHLTEGLKASLSRLRLDYVDLVFCHRPDPETPIEETVLAMSDLVRAGYAFYWGTSEWSAAQIEEAIRIAYDYRAIAPSMEQPQYNMFWRDRFEKEYRGVFDTHRYGTTIWSPLASGLLTGKYNDGIPQDSRLARMEWLRTSFKDRGWLDKQVTDKLRALDEVARSVGASLAQLAIAWTLKNPDVSTVILGASRVEQLDENLKAAELQERLDHALMARIEGILQNKP
jgi:voltage-dependent potassium channel beta subunit